MKRNTVLLVFLALVLFTSGCGGKTVTQRTTPISATLNADGSAGRVNEFQTNGNLPLSGATFLASTKLEVTSSDKNQYNFVATFPTNTTADMAIKITPNQKYSPEPGEAAVPIGGQSYNVRVTHSITGNTYKVTLHYFLPKSVLTASLIPGLISAPSLYRPIVYIKPTPGYGGVSLAGEDTGTGIDFEVALSEAGKEFGGKVEEGVMEALGKEGNPLSTTEASALEVIDALDTSAEYKDLQSQLDELQAQAENPTNPLTEKAYADDPNLKQSILDEIDSARSELQWDTAAQYMNQEISVGAGLIGLAELSVAIAPIVDWNSKTLKQLKQERVDQIRKMITTGTGSMKPKTPPAAADAGPTGYIPETNTGTTLPAGTWVATYEGTHKEVLPSGMGTTTITDKGTITFRLDKTGTVTGEGRGHFTFQVVGQDYHTDGATDYTFSVTGSAVTPAGTPVGAGEVFLILGSVPSPYTFEIVSVTNDGKKETSIMPLGGPMLIQGVLKLKSGDHLESNQDNSQGGMQITETRTMTMN